MKKEKSYKAEQFQAALIQTIKNLAAPVIILAVAVLAVLLIIKFAAQEKEPTILQRRAYEGSAEPIVVKNNDLILTFDPTTAQIQVEVVKTGAVWRSNPEGVGIDQKEWNQFASSLLLTFQTKTGDSQTYNTYSYSATNGIFEVEAGSDYLTVDYSIGEVAREFVIPPVKTEADFKEWLSKMSQDDSITVENRYKKLDINNLKKADKEKKDDYLERFPLFETEVIYILREEAGDNVKASMERIFSEAGYTYEEFLADKENDLNEASSDKPIFNVEVTYRLVGDELVVELPLSKIEHPDGKYPTAITLLPYFGAGTTEDSGYCLVPEGGGGIINFNNGKIAQNVYSANVYGWDRAISRDQVVQDPKSYFNAFGIARDGHSMLCILEDGVSYASVKADIAGKNNNILNYVNAEYTICAREEYKVSDIADTKIYVFEDNLPDETITQRYRFIDSDSYVDMAANYQEYLLDKFGSNLTMNTDSSVPVVVDIIGAIDKVRQVLGVPVSRPLALTTFSEAETIINELTQNIGVKNLSVKMSGWCNGGVKQNILKRVSVLSSLGGKSGLQSLSDTAKSQGVNLYLNGITQSEYNSNIFDGFFSYTDAAKRISKERAEQHIYSAVTYAEREGTDPFYLLHADLGLEMMDNLVGAAEKYNTGVSFEDAGKELASDFYIKDTVSREKNLNDQIAKLKEYSDSGMAIMVNSGNDYTLGYADMITNMNMKGNEYILLDENVPFYQLAIHGLVNYTGYSINICGDDNEQILKCAEYGAGLQFTFMEETAFALQKTLYTQYYGADFNAWRDRMVEIYNRYNSELGHTFNQKMVNHTCITKELSCTEYADGTKVYVNYSYENVTADGVVVPARDYKVVR